MRIWLLILVATLTLIAGPCATAQASDEAWQVADRMIENLGGRDVWTSAQSLYVRELAYPASIDSAVTAEFWRDLEKPAYRSLIVGPSIRRETFWSAEGGWTIRDGVRTEMTSEELDAEIADWKQEPYVMYHKLALRDPTLKLQVVDGSRLEIFDSESTKLLCWFIVDASGSLLRWGNYYRGEVSEHVYGPLRDFGDVRMPSWGTSTTGSWRFEYEDVVPMKKPLDVDSWRRH